MRKLYLVLLLLGFSAFASAQYAGSPDPEFGIDGHTSLNITMNDQSYSIAMQSDGKILQALVTSDLTSYICRFNSDGSVDTDFGNNGTVAVLPPDASFVSLNTIIVMNDDRIVIGFTMGGAKFTSYYGCGRLLSDGTPDTSFSEDGFEITSVEPEAIYGGMYGIALQPDGQIISYGVTPNPNNPNILLFRHSTEGVYDEDFGDDGWAQVSFTNYGDFPMRVLFTNDNKIVVVGYSEIPSGGPLDPVFNDIGIARLDMDGQLDPDFGDGGIFSENLSDDGDWFKDAVLMPDGSLYAAGSMADGDNNGSNGPLDFLLAKITSDGEFDTSFDGDGWMQIDVDASNDILSDLKMDEEGRLILIGTYALMTGDNGFSIVRRMDDGSVDTDFGLDGTGFVTNLPGTNYSNAGDALIQPDGKILVGGFGNFVTTVDIILARYLPDGEESSVEENPHLISVYPNPVRECLYLNATGLALPVVRIYDSRGRVVLAQHSSIQNGIDVRDLVPGIYVLCADNYRSVFVKE